MKFRYLILFSFVFSFAIITDGQTEMPNSPEAAIAQKFVDVPVSLYSGSPQFSIPIYDAVSRDVSIPITLSFHSNGIRVQEEASWVGLGWHLSAGGMITREIRGYDDFGGIGPDCLSTLSYESSISQLPAPPTSQTSVEYFDYNNTAAHILFDQCPYTCTFVSNGSGNQDDDIFCPDMAFKPDPQPDLFTFSFAGYSGKFQMNSLGEYIPFTNHGILIDQIGTNEAPKWEITTPDGVKYYFGEEDESVQRTYSSTLSIFRQLFGTAIGSGGMSSSQPCGSKSITSWYLSRVESPNDDMITIDYEKEERAIRNIPGYSEERVDNLKSCIQLYGCLPEDTGLGSFTQIVSKTELDLVLPKQINLRYGRKIVFRTSSRYENGKWDLIGAKKLDAIDIYNPGLVKTWKFNYSYASSITIGQDWTDVDILDPLFQDNFNYFFLGSNDARRLRLESVQEFGGNEKLPPYLFEYSNVDFPKKTSLAVDRWGYFNGKNNSTLLPMQAIVDSEPFAAFCENSDAQEAYELFIPGADRSPSQTLAEAGLLKKVTYPTKGTMELEYELNDFALPEPIWEGSEEGVNLYNINYPNGGSQDDREQTIEIGSDRPVPDATISISGTWKVDRDCDNCSTGCGGELIISTSTPAFKIEIFPEVHDPADPPLFEYFFFPPDLGDPNDDEPFFMQGTTTVLDPGRYVVKLRAAEGCGTSFPQNLYEASADIKWGNYQLITSNDGGGVRVSNTKVSDQRGSVIEKIYKYEAPGGGSSGQIMNNPRFGQRSSRTVQGVACSGNIPTVTTRKWTSKSSSIRPIQSSFAGTFVGYSNVQVEHGLGGINGITYYKYHNNQTSFFNEEDATSPIPFDLPRFYDLGNGNLLEQIDVNAGGDTVHAMTNKYINDLEYFDWMWVTLPSLIFRDENVVGRSCAEVYRIFYYAMIPQWVRLDTSIEYFYGHDGSGPAVKTTAYTYDVTNYQLKSSEFNNSDGRLFKSVNKYPHDFGYTFMTSINWINQVIEQQQIVDGTPVAGSRSTYKVHNGVIVPDAVSNYEGQAWDLVGTYTEYDPTDKVFPTVFVKEHYTPQEIYTWENGLMTSRTYSDFNWTFDYFTNNRKLKKRTEPNQTYITFQYDGLQRVKNMTEFGNQNGKKTSTDITYSYNGPSNNLVTTKIDFFDAPTRTSIKYHDGLGRYYKTLKINYVNGMDVITDELSFDDFNRVKSKTYLPGSKTILDYYSEPLNRLQMETYPDGASVTYEYGTSGDFITSKRFDENDNPTTTHSEFVDRTKKIINPAGGETVWTYDNYGNILSILTPANNLYEYTYNYDQNHLASKSVPGGGTTSYDFYDDKDILKSEEDASGPEIIFDYDEHDRITTTTSDGDLIINNVWGDGLHVDQLDYVENKILETGGTFVKSDFQYDEHGRVEMTDITGSPVGIGTENLTYKYDHADQVRSTERVHSGHQVLNISSTNSYDTWGRLTAETFAMPDLDQTTLMSHRYNQRDEIVASSVGGVYTLNYKYHIRGWLTDINKPFSVLPPDLHCDIPTFPGPEDIDDTEDPNILDDFYLTVEQLLVSRFDIEMDLEGYDPCQNTETCPDPSCTPQEIADQQADIQLVLQQMKDTYTDVRLIKCEGVDTMIHIINYSEDDLLPVDLVRIRLCDDSEHYVLAEYLSSISGDYSVVQQITVSDPLEEIVVEIGSQTRTILWEEALQLVFNGMDLTIDNYIPCELACDEPEVTCTSEALTTQKNLIQQWKGSMQNLDVADLSFPLTLYRVVLCGGASLYLTADEITDLSSTPYIIVDSTTYQTPQDTVIAEFPEETEGDEGIFYLKLHYDKSQLGATARYNGDITTMEWQVAGRPRQAYAFDYDVLNRVNEGIYHENLPETNGYTQTDRFSVTGISYDADGNIETLTREGILSVSPEGCPVYGTIDELDYTYSGNRVTSISEMQATKGFYVPSGTAAVSYTYHPDGNLLSDNGKGITQIDYNYLNLPSEILIPGKTLSFTYDASGTKWSKEGLDLDGQTSTYDYAMGVEYQDNQISGVYHSAGRAAIDPETSEWRHEFHVRDHLGNLRVAITEDLEVLDAVDYYPFGMRYGQGLTLQQQSQIWPLRKDTVPGEDHFYNGKEYQFDRIGYDTDGTVVELGWYDYGARFYDPSVGRWTSVDPLAELYAPISPYAYVANNPINLIDPNGMEIKGLTKDDAAKFQEDVNTVFSDDKFESFRGLISRNKKGRGKKFNKIDSDALSSALGGVELSDDEQALVGELVGAINSDAEHVVEFADVSGSVSKEGSSAFKAHLNKTAGPGVGNAMIPGEQMPGVTMNAISGGGLNIPTESGSHSVIMEGAGVSNHGGNRATTTMHEVLGHGVAAGAKVFGDPNNARAVRVDNLVRRVMGITNFRTEHGGKVIKNPNALPKRIN